MQRIAGCIQCHHHLILHQKNAHRICRSILRKPIQMIGTLHTLHHRLLCNGLYIRRTKKLAFDGRCFRHPELSVLWNILLPRQCLNPLKKLIKCRGMKTSHLQKYTLSTAQKDIGTADCLGISFESDSSIFYLCNFISQIIYFSLCNGLQSKMAWHH